MNCNNAKQVNKIIIVKIITFFIILLVCIVKLFFCSISIDGSTIYDCMTADYYNFAKNMINGKLLYKDLLDHKGLYLYLIYIPCVLISGNNPISVVFVETLIFIVTIASCFYFCYKVTNKNKNISLIYTMIFSLCYFGITIKTVLINTEGLLAIFYFLIFSYVINCKKIMPKNFFLIGIILGIFINIKYTSILSFFGLFIYISFVHFYHKNNILFYIKSILMGILGIVIVNIPFFIYLISTNTLEYYLSFVRMTSDVNIKPILFYLIVSLFILFLSLKEYKNNNIIKSSKFLAISCLITLFIGSIVSNQYLAYSFVILFSFVFCENKLNLSVLFYIGFTLYFICLQNINNNLVLEDSWVSPTKDVAKKYGINNSNIFYLTEDAGFGIYSDETFVEPYQWVPFRYYTIKDMSDKIFQIEKDRLISKKFEYVFVDSKFLTEERRKNEVAFGYEKEIYKKLAPILLENYEPIDQCLWRRKK